MPLKSATISGMRSHKVLRQSGYSALVLSLSLSIFFLVVAIVFGAWAFMQMLDYKDHSDAKVAAAVTQAKTEEDSVKDAAFAEVEKQPLRTYQGSATYGSVNVSYPKTWSAYVVDTRNTTPFIDGYFYPGSVPDVTQQASVFALRVQVVDDDYSNVVKQLTSLVQQGKATVTPYKAPKVPSVIGVRVDGQITFAKTGSMVILPLRNMTLKVWTEGPQFENDFNTNILPNLTFKP